MDDIFSNQIRIFKSVFKGREDVFAIRWEKENKSGYMPSYSFDPYLYRAHKKSGGTFQNYKDKTYQNLTDKEIAKHLRGEQLIGIYPLLSNNTSHFLAADFDESDWINDARKFLNACNEKDIPAYLERSRSGNGGHVWIFFDQPYPAVKSRKIIITILEQAGIFSQFDKGSSFDRVFPNQDFLSGKGLGNLIALPLYKKTFEQGNSCFIDPKNQVPFEDQYAFLEKIKRITSTQLDKLYQDIPNASPSIVSKISNGKLIILLNNQVQINRVGMTSPLINYLKEELNFANSEFIIRKRTGRNTSGTNRFFKFVEETENEVIIPRGFIGKLIRFCRENKIDHDFIDQRQRPNTVQYIFNATLREHQQTVIDAIAKKDLGVIVAPPGSGKTIVALKIIAEKQQPALIIVHRKQLLEQWIERIETFLGIPKHEIGKVGQGKYKLGSKITIATIQSLSKEINKNESEILKSNFGTIILDECHHIPAETFRNTISKLKTYHLYGLTATPFRKNNDEKLIFIHLGDIIAEIKPNQIRNSKRPKIIVRLTDLAVPFNSRTDTFETLSKILIHDSSRNRLILKDITYELKQGKKVVIITERKEHIDSLYQYLKQSHETITLCGDDTENNRKTKWKILNEGNYQVLITTGQFFGEGSDLQNANCLFLVYPFSFKGKLIQYIGRVQRSEIAPTIYDYRDIKIDYLNKLFLKRNTYYRKIEKQATLFDEPDEVYEKPKILTVEKEIKIPVSELEFRYGSIAFLYTINELKQQLEFEIENLEVRQEFEVLKPYFARALGASKVNINIYAEFEEEKLVSQLATSADIESINQELIESVRFTFVTKHIIGKKALHSQNPSNINQLQNVDSNLLYKSGEELLEDILKLGKYKHQKQLHYLAHRHDKSILKVRYVLAPFSFVFLLTGTNGFHIVLETLDTEEATYIWHFPKDLHLLKSKLKEVDEHLGIIRNKGRQAFLTNQPQNFSRILHDYLDIKKGFIIWKDLLEERIV